MPETFTHLRAIRVLEFTHAIMGPACGVALADLGAEVIKVEPSPAGDYTRHLKGYGSGFFAQFNRNKKSLAVNLKTEDGKEIIQRLLHSVDVVIENFAPGTMDRLGFGYDDVSQINERIIFCSLKGFMPGPYENRTALDEPTQMMSGLAYMTGPPGNPLRAGASVIDILSATYGVIGILAALRERDQTGQGQLVQNGLFETATYLVGQHLAYSSTQDEPIEPFPGKVRSWAIYRLFDTKDDKKVFIAVTSDKHWEQFCRVFDRQDLYVDPSLATNNLRYEAAARLLPDLELMFRSMQKSQILQKCEQAGIPYAPVNQVEDLWEDPHLNEAGTFLRTEFPHHDIVASLPRQPLQFNQAGHGIELQPPLIGEHTRRILLELGYDAEQISALEGGSTVYCSQ